MEKSWFHIYVFALACLAGAFLMIVLAVVDGAGSLYATLAIAFQGAGIVFLMMSEHSRSR